MRPTFLNFRSPKELTPDFYCPRVTNDGKALLESYYRSHIGKKSISPNKYDASLSSLQNYTAAQSTTISSSMFHGAASSLSLHGSSPFLSNVDRFRYQEKLKQTGSGFRVGPGSYEPLAKAVKKREDFGVPKIKKLTVD